MRGPMRVMAFLVLVPVLTVAVVRAPLVASFVQVTRVLPPGPANALDALPFEPNTTLALVAAAVFLGAAMLMRRPAWWLAAGVGGFLAFAYFPFGFVQWGGSAIQDAYTVQTTPGISNGLVAALPVAAMLALLLADQARTDAATWKERGIDAGQVRAASAGAMGLAVLLSLLVATLAGAVAGLTHRLPLDAFAGPWRSWRLLVVAGAALLGMLGIFLLAGGGAAPDKEDDERRIMDAD